MVKEIFHFEDRNEAYHLLLKFKYPMKNEAMYEVMVRVLKALVQILSPETKIILKKTPK